MTSFVKIVKQYVIPWKKQDNEYLKRYEEFKKSNSHEEAKKRASDSVVNAKNILRERNEIYNKRYSIYQENQERQNKIEEENKKDLEDNYMSL